ncbi:MAG: carboxypeptidase-like regulatory domain-containing protein [Proteobacteria bacterium]|nr:carboxypeptidase-like regulatory domain-containing protein [Pseudomonadota bacterium]
MFSLLFAEENKVFVKGKVLFEDSKDIRGTISFFSKDNGVLPDPEYYMMIPDEVIELKNDGSFEGQVIAGIYYIGINLNSTGKKGPVTIGDRFSLIKKGDDVTEFNLTNIKTYDFGKININPSVLKEFKIKTCIFGKVIDENNKPLSNVYVFAFIEEKKTKKPLYISEPTDKEGRFILRLGSGGRYILRVRNVIDGGPPKQGYIIGVYGQKDNPKVIEIKEGETINNIEIKADKI